MSSSNYTAQLQLYDQAVERFGKTKRKGKTMPYTSHNGYMFSLLDQTGRLNIRLSPTDLEAFTRDYSTEKSVQYGKNLREFAYVPQAVLTDTQLLSKLLEKGYNYVSTLKPKKK